MPKFTPETAQSEHHDGTGHPCGPYEAILFSDSGGLTQFGAFVEVLPPGSSSSLKHWHANEDEMVYMLAGTATVHEGDQVYALHEGEAATFKAGVEAGHRIENTGKEPIRYLVIGTRSDSDTVIYPDHDRVYRLRRAGGNAKPVERIYTTFGGEPANSPYDMGS